MNDQEKFEFVLVNQTEISWALVRKLADNEYDGDVAALNVALEPVIHAVHDTLDKSKLWRRQSDGTKIAALHTIVIRCLAASLDDEAVEAVLDAEKETVN